MILENIFLLYPGKREPAGRLLRWQSGVNNFIQENISVYADGFLTKPFACFVMRIELVFKMEFMFMGLVLYADNCW